MTSNRYNDGIMEIGKLNEFFAHRDEYNYAFLVSFFDDCWAISNIKSPIGESIKTASHTTDFADKRKIKKDFIHYNIKRYDY